MPVVNLPINNGYYVAESAVLSSQVCNNLYPVKNQIPALVEEYLVGTQGIRELNSSVAEPNRGGHVMRGIPYVVNGNKLYKVVETFVAGNPVYTMDDLGTIPQPGRVSMADNGNQLMIIIPGVDGYIYNATTDTLAIISDVDFKANGLPKYCAFVDSYFIVTTDDDRFIRSAANDGTNWNALDFGTADSSPDCVVAPIVFNNQLFITGVTTTEAFQNVGGADFGFQRTGLFLQKGCAAPFSLINTQNSFVWIGGGLNETPAVWSFVGNSVQKISTNAIDLLLGSINEAQLAAVYAWTYSRKGSFFVGFSLPDRAIVYDYLTNKWHTRTTRIDDVQETYLVSAVMTAYQRLLCTSRYCGRLGELRDDVYQDFGTIVTRTFVTLPFFNNNQLIKIPMMELMLESGVGNENATDPMVVLERSVDGKTWQAPRARPIGKIGEYNRRAIWYKNGRASRFELFKFTIADAIKVVIIQLTGNIIGGSK
jgi:hypothetical protein